MVRSARARGKLARKASEGVKVAALSVAPKHKVASQQPMGGRPSKKSGSTTAVNSKVRVWWPPTNNKKKTDFSGMYWPAIVISSVDDSVQVVYDNGDKEIVDAELVQPQKPPIQFGGEKEQLQVGEFVEVFNNSKSDPAEWVARVKKVNKKSYTVDYPFHDSDNETIKEALIRRARLWDAHTGTWSLIAPFQDWEDGEVTSPLELALCSEKELMTSLAAARGQEASPQPQQQKVKSPVKPTKATGSAAAAQQQNAASSKPQAEAQSQASAPAAVSHSPAPKPAGTPAAAQQPLVSVPAPVGVTGAHPLPTNWIPAPAYGPGSYLIPNANPNEPPFLVHTDQSRSAYLAVPAASPASAPDTSGGDLNTSTGKKKKRSAKKDPNAPKRPMNAYILYINSHRDKVKEEMPDASAQEVTKKLAAMWNTTTSEERRLLQEEAERDRLRYEEEMAEYIVPPGFQLSEDDEESTPQKRQRAKKDKDAPKRPRTAYILFSMDYRKSEVSPAVSFRDATNQAAEAWKIVSPDTKAKYAQLAANEKNAYEAASLVYKQHKEAEAARARLAQAISNAAPASGASALTAQQQAATQQATQQPQANPIMEMLSAMPAQTASVADHGAELLDLLDLDAAKAALKQENLGPDAFYRLVDVWRKGSPQFSDAVRAFKAFIQGKAQPDWKGFMIGIFGWQTVQELSAKA